MITLETVFMIHDLKDQGLSISAIARQTGLDRKTVRRHLAAGIHSPTYGPRPAQDSIIDPYRHYLKARIDAYPDRRSTNQSDSALVITRLGDVVTERSLDVYEHIGAAKAREVCA